MQHSISVRSKLQGHVYSMPSILAYRLNSYLEHIVLRLVYYIQTEKIPKGKTKFNLKWTKEFGFISRSRKDYFLIFGTVYHCIMERVSKGKKVQFIDTPYR